MPGIGEVAELLDPLDRAGVGGVARAGPEVGVALDQQVPHRDAGADAGEDRRRSGGPEVAPDGGDAQHHHQRVHGDALVPAQAARREVGHLGQVEASEACTTSATAVASHSACGPTWLRAAANRRGRPPAENRGADGQHDRHQHHDLRQRGEEREEEGDGVGVHGVGDATGPKVGRNLQARDRSGDDGALQPVEREPTERDRQPVGDETEQEDRRKGDRPAARPRPVRAAVRAASTAPTPPGVGAAAATVDAVRNKQPEAGPPRRRSRPPNTTG